MLYVVVFISFVRVSLLTMLQFATSTYVHSFEGDSCLAARNIPEGIGSNT